MTYLIGIGNYLQGDDGIGPRLIEAVCERGLDTSFEVMEIAANGVDLLTRFVPETESMLIIDCARMGLAPGEYRLFSPAEATTRKPLPNLSTHDNDLLHLIDYGRAVGCPVPPIRILAIQPQTIALGAPLSPPLQHHFEDYLKLALAELSQNAPSASLIAHPNHTALHPQSCRRRLPPSRCACYGGTCRPGTAVERVRLGRATADITALQTTHLATQLGTPKRASPATYSPAAKLTTQPISHNQLHDTLIHRRAARPPCFTI